jgi:hypothetical protein
MKKHLLFGFLILFLECGDINHSKQYNKIVSFDSLKIISKKDKVLYKLDGIWAENKEDNALFYIKNDSIYYLDDLKPYHYKLINDTLTIYLDNFISKSILVKNTNDSLLLKELETGEIIRLYNRSK